MSALALILNEVGFKVSGSDSGENYMTKSMKEKGIKVLLGHEGKNITEKTVLVVKSSAIKDDNAEIVAAKKLGIKIVRRVELLALIMRCKYGITVAGTHGKTSTTAMTGILLEVAGFDPTVLNGGVINYYNTNSKFGSDKYLVAESDESDGGFVELPSKIGIVTNIEPEHLEYYGGSFDLEKKYFERYIDQITDMVALCIDDPEIRKIYESRKNNKKNIKTFGLAIGKNEADYDLIASNIKVDLSGTSFEVRSGKDKFQKPLAVKMPLYGTHNASNALGAIAVAKFLGINDGKIKEGLAKFDGVQRRFTRVGELNGITIVDDYAHHPTEIKVVLKVARQLACDHKVICVFQPHRFTRVRDLFKEFCGAFNDADVVIVSDIYTASEKPIEGITQDSIVDGLQANKKQQVIKLENEKDLAQLIKQNGKQGDLAIFVGAGTITYWAKSLIQNS